MASIVALQAASVATLAPMSLKKAAMPGSSSSKISSLSLKQRVNEKASRGPKVVCAVGDVSAEGTNYLIAGAIAIALVGTALPILFSRKDLCPECDGAGFVRKNEAIRRPHGRWERRREAALPSMMVADGNGRWCHAHVVNSWRTPGRRRYSSAERWRPGGILPAPETTAGAIRQRRFTHKNCTKILLP